MPKLSVGEWGMERLQKYVVTLEVIVNHLVCLQCLYCLKNSSIHFQIKWQPFMESKVGVRFSLAFCGIAVRLIN
jgi:hypothetical protein